MMRRINRIQSQNKTDFLGDHTNSYIQPNSEKSVIALVIFVIIGLGLLFFSLQFIISFPSIAFAFYPGLFLSFLSFYSAYESWREYASQDPFAPNAEEKIVNGLNDRPYTLDLSKTSSYGINILVMVGLFFILYPVGVEFWFSYYSKNPFNIHNLSTASLISILIGILFLIKSLSEISHKNIVIFEKSGLSILKEGLLGKTLDETLPYAAFEGALLHEVIVRERVGNNKKRDVAYQRVTLVHPEERLSIKLYQVLSHNAARYMWKIFAHALSIPAIETDGDGYSISNHDKINETLQEKSVERSLEMPQVDGLGRVPGDLEVRYSKEKEGRTIKIDFLARRVEWGYGWLVPIFIVITSIVFELEASSLLIGLMIAGAMTLHQILDDRYKRSLTLTRSHIELHDVLKYNISAFLTQDYSNVDSRKIPLKQIEKILIKKYKGKFSYILIATQGKQFNIGARISQDTLEWLQNYLRAAIITA